MTYPKNVKDVKNLNEFIRKARELETDKYWSNILYDCSSANYADWTRRESRLKWKREMIQKYLNYKNKVEESYGFDDYNKRVQDYCDNELNQFIDMLRAEFPKCTISKPIKSKKGEYRLQLRHKDLIITIMLMELLTTDSGKPEYAISYDGHQTYIGPKEDVIDFINKYIKEDHKLEEKATIDWNNYLTPEEVKKFLSKDDKNESAEAIIYSKEFEPRYKDLHNPLQAKYKNSWTKKELVDDLANFYYQGNLITETKLNKNIKDKLLDIISWYSFEYFYNDYEESKNEKILNNIESKILDNSKLDKLEINFLNEVIDSYLGDINHNHRISKDFKNYMKKLNESKHKIEEKSRNELLAKTKSQTITRYNKAQEYKGFYIRGVDTDELLKKDSLLTVNCQVGNYRDQVQMENMLYWIEYEIEERNHDLQVTSKYITQALMDAIDGMNIKVNCECRRLAI